MGYSCLLPVNMAIAFTMFQNAFQRPWRVFISEKDLKHWHYTYVEARDYEIPPESLLYAIAKCPTFLQLLDCQQQYESSALQLLDKLVSS